MPLLLHDVTGTVNKAKTLQDISFIAIYFYSPVNISIPVVLPEKPITIKSSTVIPHEEITVLPIPLTTTKKVVKRFQRKCRAMTNIVFLKTHKTASSTIQVRMTE